METIKPTYTTFGQSKWLKEKAFNEKCETSYYTHYEKLMIENNGVTKITPMHNYSRPEQWQVVEWLRINHGIWVSPGIINLNGVVKWFPICFKFVNGLLEIPKDIDGNFNSPQEAYSAAFDYIKENNLI